MEKKKKDPNAVEVRGTRRKIVYSLDWFAQSYEERLACVKNLEKRGMLEGLSPTQLNEVTKYLLYSENVDCQVELRKPPKPPVSFEELAQNGVADRAYINARYRNIYKRPKPGIDREKDKDIPGMQELWAEIEKVKKMYDYLDDCLKGRREKDPDCPVEINYVVHHFYKKWYIDLCTQQYLIRDFYRPVVGNIPTDEIIVKEDTDLEFGICAGKYVYNQSDDKFMIDLANPVHIHSLLRSYKQVGKQHTESEADDWNILYELLDEAIAITPFADDRWYILQSKAKEIPNKEIAKGIEEKWGKRYNDNYISTLFAKNISKAIAKSAMNNAKRHFEEEDIFICLRCKQERWEDEFEDIFKPCLYCQGKMEGIGRSLRREVIDE